MEKSCWSYLFHKHKRNIRIKFRSSFQKEKKKILPFFFQIKRFWSRCAICPSVLKILQAHLLEPEHMCQWFPTCYNYNQFLDSLRFSPKYHTIALEIWPDWLELSFSYVTDEFFEVLSEWKIYNSYIFFSFLSYVILYLYFQVLGPVWFQDLLFLTSRHMANRSKITRLDDWPEWILKILLINYEVIFNLIFIHNMFFLFLLCLKEVITFSKN